MSLLLNVLALPGPFLKKIPQSPSKNDIKYVVENKITFAIYRVVENPIKFNCTKTRMTERTEKQTGIWAKHETEEN